MKEVRFRGRGWRVAGGQKVHTVYIVVMVVSLLGAMKLGKRKLQRLHDSYSINGIGPRYLGNPLIANAIECRRYKYLPIISADTDINRYRY